MTSRWPCEKPADGTCWASIAIFSRIARSTGACSNRRTVRRFMTSSANSTTHLLGRWWHATASGDCGQASNRPRSSPRVGATDGHVARRRVEPRTWYNLHMHSERTQVLLTPAQRERLQRIAVREGRSLGAVIRDAIDAYPLPRARPRDEALRSL